ncbi:Tetratricopeptide TPR_2 repeat [Micractinium conductrix]|uniref:Tetratricopeptide TPR_2 repeat n=1 Tax=Micractinium conductrix TaxID=554055 RepID=A0A2P6V867_9CHLO|nr:Tetratricopeptide TPR_2 repeat [Micractinium conductrix]|eukprot:PSC70273.1 Tetratricopeptide TPR_2 repeat [Micractinium conductrix]
MAPLSTASSMGLGSNASSPYRYINSGSFIGPCDKVRCLLDDNLPTFDGKRIISDQGFWQHLLANSVGSESIVLDTAVRMFHVIGGRHPRRPESEVVCDPAMGTWCNPHTFTCPYVLHCNGLPKDFMYDVIMLSREQLLWIAESVHGKAAAHSGGDPRLLVFGVRFDSGDWVAVNCRGRTVFLEHAAAWMAKANKKNELEAYLVSYRGNTKAVGDFFAQPWLMEVPAAIEDACWDVILVDGPTGHIPGQPGRMESTFYAVSTARRCIKAKQVDDVIVFLHDAERPVE